MKLTEVAKNILLNQTCNTCAWRPIKDLIECGQPPTCNRYIKEELKRKHI